LLRFSRRRGTAFFKNDSDKAARQRGTFASQLNVLDRYRRSRLERPQLKVQKLLSKIEYFADPFSYVFG